MADKKCTICNLSEPDVKFNGNRKDCNSCKSKKTLANKKEKAKEGQTQICKDCNEEKPYDKFHGFLCNSCHHTSKTTVVTNNISAQIENHLEKTGNNISNEELAIKNGQFPNECRECKNPFSKEEFGYANDKAKFKSTCKECFNKYKYYETYRKKKMEEDPEEYKKHNAIIHLEYTKKYPEIVEKQNEDNKTIPHNKIVGIKNSSNRREIVFEDNDIEEMKIKLSKKCTYCNYKHEIYLNGLDRIDNNIGYTNSNTVPCCKTCNYMKADNDIDSFYHQIEKISKYNHAKFNDNDLEYITRDDYTLPHSNFGSNTRIDLDDKSGTKIMDLTKKEQKEIKSQKCSYCNGTGGSIDRRDSSKHYTISNSLPCCKTCNYIKKDLHIEDFIKHVIRIQLLKDIKDDESEDDEDYKEEKIVKEFIKEEEKVVKEFIKKEEKVVKKYIQHNVNKRHIQALLYDSNDNIAFKAKNLNEIGDFVNHSNINVLIKDSKDNIIRGYKLKYITPEEYETYKVDEEAYKLAVEYMKQFKPNVIKTKNCKYITNNMTFTKIKTLSNYLNISNSTMSYNINKNLDDNIYTFVINGHEIQIIKV